MNSKHQTETLVARKSSSSSMKAVSDCSVPIPKQRKITAMNQARIESYRPLKNEKLIKINKNIMNMIDMDN